MTAKTTATALTGVEWFKSSYSNGNGTACVEGAHLASGDIAVRDSKDPQGPVLVLAGGAWGTFVGGLGRTAGE